MARRFPPRSSHKRSRGGAGQGSVGDPGGGGRAQKGRPVAHPLRNDKKTASPKARGIIFWQPLGDSNPCQRAENPASWTTRRRGRLMKKKMAGERGLEPRLPDPESGVLPIRRFPTVLSPPSHRLQEVSYQHILRSARGENKTGRGACFTTPHRLSYPLEGPERSSFPCPAKDPKIGR